MQKPIPATPFLRDIAQRWQIPLDESLLEDYVRLAQLPDDPFERRSVDLELHSDGRVKATSLKPYNLLLFSQGRFRFSILKITAGTAAVLTGQVVPTVLGLIALIAEFLERVPKEFQEQDAKVLYAVYRLGSLCHISTIAPEYGRLFGEVINDEGLNASLSLLAKYKTLRFTPSDEVEIIETVNVTRQ
jgi:hypothetical protein